MDKFSFKHIFFVICSVTIVSLKTYPQVFMNISGRNSWICVIISGIIMILYFDYLIKTAVKNDCYNLKDIFTTALGNFWGRLFLALFAMGLFLSLIESVAVHSNVVHTNLFIESPTWYILLFIVLPGLYIVKNGKKSIMAVIMVCIIISIINGINLAILTERFKQYKRLFPVFEEGLNYSFILGIIKSLGLYSSVAISLPYISQVQKTKNIRRATFIGNVFVAQMIVIAIIGLMATFNVERANTLVYPKLIQTQLISYFGFIASGEFYVIFQVISGWFAKYIATFFSLMLVLKELNIDKLFNMEFLPYSLSLVVYMLAYAVSNNLLGLFKFLNYHLYICLIVFFIMPLFIFTIYGIRVKINRKKGKN